MTSKQTERLRKKIADIKKTLAAEKRKFGCYDDSRGRRYLPTKYFVQLQDYSGGLAYLKWFDKQFPDDSGFPESLFASTIILFKTDKVKLAESKAFETFFSNTYVFTKYFDKPLIPVDIYEGSNTASLFYLDAFEYSSQQEDLADFTTWLEELISSKDFKDRCDKYIDIYKRLKSENDREKRYYLLMQARQLY